MIISVPIKISFSKGRFGREPSWKFDVQGFIGPQVMNASDWHWAKYMAVGMGKWMVIVLVAPERQWEGSPIHIAIDLPEVPGCGKIEWLGVAKCKPTKKGCLIYVPAYRWDGRKMETQGRIEDTVGICGQRYLILSLPTIKH